LVLDSNIGQQHKHHPKKEKKKKKKEKKKQIESETQWLIFSMNSFSTFTTKKYIKK
jgi:hypothetical protein